MCCALPEQWQQFAFDPGASETHFGTDYAERANPCTMGAKDRYSDLDCYRFVLKVLDGVAILCNFSQITVQLIKIST